MLGIRAGEDTRLQGFQGLRGLVFRVLGLGFKGLGSGFKGLGLKGLGFRLCRVSDSGFRAKELWLWA